MTADRSDTPQPLTIWMGTTTFDKDGAPFLGTKGASMARVIVIGDTTWRRMLKEHPTLAAAQFRVGDLDG